MAWIPGAVMAGASVYSAFKGSKGGGGGMGGSSPKLKRYETLTHGEKQIHKDILKRINPKALDILNSPMFQQARNYYQGILGGDTAAFEKPLMTQFQQEIAPGIAERFAGAGAMNSSGFQQAMGGAGANLMERLGMLRANLQSGAAGNLANMSQMQTGNMMGLVNQAFSTPSFGYANMQGQPSFLQSAAPGIGQAFGNYAFSNMGNWGGSGGGGGASPTQRYIDAPQGNFGGW